MSKKPIVELLEHFASAADIFRRLMFSFKSHRNDVRVYLLENEEYLNMYPNTERKIPASGEFLADFPQNFSPLVDRWRDGSQPGEHLRHMITEHWPADSNRDTQCFFRIAVSYWQWYARTFKVRLQEEDPVVRAYTDQMMAGDSNSCSMGAVFARHMIDACQNAENLPYEPFVTS